MVIFEGSTIGQAVYTTLWLQTEADSEWHSDTADTVTHSVYVYEYNNVCYKICEMN